MLLSRRISSTFGPLKSKKFQWLHSSSYYSEIHPKKPKLAPLQERNMVDRFRLCAKGGDGGNGCTSFRRSRQDRHGRPDGGNGGKGGDVILECSAAVWDFSNLQHHLNAKKGGHGASKNMIGSRGADKVAQVPVGTVIHLVMGEVPSRVEQKSTRALDPWEIPDTDEVSSSSLCQITGTSNNMKQPLERKDLDEVSLSARMSKMNQTSSFSGVESTTPMKYSFSDSEESENKHEEMVYDEMSGMEFEEGEEEEEEVQYNVAELTEPGQKFVIARGGEGGLGNISLTKDPKTHKHNKHKDNNNNNSNNVSDVDNSDDENQPSVSQGSPGCEALLILELKSIADVGLVGMPNVGKSTLLGAISRAKPVIADYAFTTLRPNIGNLNYEDFFSVKVADIPGLIKGAHENRGLGHAFLRHIERTKVLAYVVDLSAALDGKKGVQPWEQLRDLMLELEHHQEGLADRPSLVVANKIDEEGTDDVLEELKRRVQGVVIYPVCAVLEEGIPELKAGLRKLVDGEELGRLRLVGATVD